MNRQHMIALVMGVSLLVAGQAMAGESVRFVRADALPAGDGLSWGTAYVHPQDALDERAGGASIDQIWIAAGTYEPTDLTDARDPRSATFNVPDGVSLYGGFAGTESSISDRIIGANETILTGDLLGDDEPNFVNRQDNAYHVVSIAGGNVRLDGLTITGGNSIIIPDTVGPNDGGGILCGGPGTLTLAQCILTGNQAASGGAILMQGMTWEAVNTRFSNNRAIDLVDEGGIFLGGAISSGALLDIAGRFVNCEFIGNHADSGGGAISGFYSGFEIINCTFAGNSTDVSLGGSVLIQGPIGHLYLSNSILWDSTAPGAESPETEHFWVPSVILAPQIGACCIEGWTGSIDAEGVFSEDPGFADALGSDGIAWSGDEDVRLSAGSSCIDAGDDLLVADDAADLDGDDDATEDVPFDLDGSARIAGLSVDIGAYEAVEVICPADLNGDGAVGPADLATLLGAWGPNPGSPADFDGDGSVGPADLATLLGAWGSCQ